MNLRWLSIIGMKRVLPYWAALFALLILASAPAGAYSQNGYSGNGYTGSVTSEIVFDALPPEARQTLHLIRQGGPFPYPRDGTVFGNYEKRLPKKQRGYYHEYTVKTPGARDRGARRIVCGQPAECYYTDDHYRSFKLIRQ